MHCSLRSDAKSSFVAIALAVLVAVSGSAARADMTPDGWLADAAARTDAPGQAGVATQPESLVLQMSARVQSSAGNLIRGARDITDSALDLIGVRYKFGGQSPERGMDCSGFVKYVFEQVTGVTLPHSAREQAKVGESVAIDRLEPGDLVFFNTRRHAFSHVGIYLGDNSFIHSPNKKGSVRTDTIDGRYWKARFNGARRLLGVMPGVVSIEAAKAVLQALPSMSSPSASAAE